MFSLDEYSEKNQPLERFWILGLFLAAIFLYTLDLGNLPLRDWDEGIIANVARDIYRSQNWLYPTINGEPYYNKPPLIHILIATAYKYFGINEWSTRIIPALLSALAVPLLYGVAREVFPRRTPALFSALVYLTLLPVVRHGRLAMLDGAINCFLLFTIWCLLRARRDLRFGLGIGIGLGCIALSKGILALIFCLLVYLFILWDTPRLLQSKYLWLGLLLGTLPAFSWYLFQILSYGDIFVKNHFFNQSFDRIIVPVEGHKGPIWYYLLELCKYAWPWLLFIPLGLTQVWQNRNMSWAKLILIWGGIYLLIISLMQTKLPWYVLPIYPIFALICGARLADFWGRRIRERPFFPISQPKKSRIYSKTWLGIFSILALVGLGGYFYFKFGPVSQVDLQLVMACFALTMIAVTFLIAQQEPQFILVLWWGCYLCLTLFVMSDNWIWELAEEYPVVPVAQMIQTATPPKTIIYTSFSYNRPSLDFYSDRQVIAAGLSALKTYIEQPQKNYFLLDENACNSLNSENLTKIKTETGWTLATNKQQDKIQVKINFSLDADQ